MWLAVSIGNSRQHWGWFSGEALRTEHHPRTHWDPAALAGAERIAVASVVPALLPPWRDLGRARILTLADLPLAGTYGTLGIDRALNLVGAAARHGTPALVVDFGTAITLSAIDGSGSFAGGWILPGFRAQLRALRESTAGLPEAPIPAGDPPALAFGTEPAIQAGVFGITLAGVGAAVARWRGDGGGKGVAIATGGDGPLVCRWKPGLFDRQDPDLALWGIRAVVGE